MNGVNIKVSVIIPVFNREKVIRRAIDSALAQTLHELEVIVVDDGSTDGTREVVGSYTDPRIKYLRHPKKMFAAAARNTGMRIAHGEYIAFLDSDDEWLPDKLQLQINVLEHADQEWGCIYSGAYIHKNNQSSISLYKPTKEGVLLSPYFKSQIVIWTPTFLFRRECLKIVGFMDTSLQRGQDRDFYIRMLSHYKMAKISQPVANIFIDTTKPIADISLSSRNMLLHKHRKLLYSLGSLTRRRAHGIQWMLQAEQFFVEKRTMNGLFYLVKSLANYPFLPIRRYLSVTYKMFKCATDLIQSK
jgi:glycosyltransferase involved in cell wall biosynthesis